MAARPILTARMPSLPASRAESTESAASWLCGRKIDCWNSLSPLYRPPDDQSSVLELETLAETILQLAVTRE